MATTGASICSACPAFSTTNATTGATNIESCKCSKGFYLTVDAGGLSTCAACPEGATTNSMGATDVSQCVCDVGRYFTTDASGAATCPRCKDVIPNSASLAYGATSSDACDCVQGFYLSTANSTRACIACNPSLMDCSIPGVTLANMPIKQGGWRLGNDTAIVHECFNAAACVGAPSGAGPTLSATASRGRRMDGASGSTAGDALCAPGHTGFLCGTCVDNWHGYSDATLCVACAEGTVLGYVPLILFGIALLAIIVVFCKQGALRANMSTIEAVVDDGVAATVQAKAEEELAQKAEKMVEVGTVAGASERPSLTVRAISRLQKWGPKFKIAVSLYQILQGIGAVFACVIQIGGCAPCLALRSGLRDGHSIRALTASRSHHFTRAPSPPSEG